MTRRAMLQRCANGFGAVALAGLSQERSYGAASGGLSMAPVHSHHRRRAKNVIFLYMDGGVSHVDSFDPKPILAKEHGQPFRPKMEPTQFDNIGTVHKGHWDFQNYGQSGTPVSSLFPKIGGCADDLCVVRSMVANFSEHNQANFFLHTGFGVQGRPSMGAWVGYGLGSECDNLPGFVVLNGGLIPSGGIDNFGSGFLPASYQGTMFRAGEKPLANVQPLEASPELQSRKLNLLRRLDQGVLDRMGHVDQLESAIANYEMAYRMQAAVPELVDLKGESEATKKLYGFDAPYEKTRLYAVQCLLARRMVEKGVRFVELTCPRIGGQDRWDAHGNLKSNHSMNALAVDQPIAGLLTDLKARGLLEETLVVFAGEFGRTPFAQGSDGRDHNPFGFSVWLAGGGIQGGMTYGATDEYGYRTIENRVEMHDLHATMLHLLGVDHLKLTHRFDGRDMRLTDVHGHVVHDIIAS
ncbi:MAG: hypothetical protein ACI8T1_003874 [Verrucomicrobiales bacterium]|jgi:hypothetical protein